MATTNKFRLNASVEGRVQGVNFRMFVQATANNLMLNGWVRNRWDSSVEVLAEGDRHSLEQLLASLHRGPPAANVTRVTHDWQTATGEFKQFKIRLTSF